MIAGSICDLYTMHVCLQTLQAGVMNVEFTENRMKPSRGSEVGSAMLQYRSTSVLHLPTYSPYFSTSDLSISSYRGAFPCRMQLRRRWFL